MEQSEIPALGVVSPPPGGAGEPAGGASGAGAGKKARGRPVKAESALAYLAANGLVAVPAGETPPDPENIASGPVGADCSAFDEETTRQTVAFLVGQYSEFKSESFREAAATATGEKAIAESYGERAKLSEAKSNAMTGAAVEVCRRQNVSLSPEITLAVIFANEWREFRAFRADMRRLAAARIAAQSTPRPDAEPA